MVKFLICLLFFFLSFNNFKIFKNLIFHIVFLKFNKIKIIKRIKNDLPELVEIFLSQNESDESKFLLLESLCWIDQIPLAQKILSTIQIPENLNTLSKLLIREIFNINYFKIDDM